MTPDDSAKPSQLAALAESAAETMGRLAITASEPGVDPSGPHAPEAAVVIRSLESILGRMAQVMNSPAIREALPYSATHLASAASHIISDAGQVMRTVEQSRRTSVRNPSMTVHGRAEPSQLAILAESAAETMGRLVTTASGPGLDPSGPDAPEAATVIRNLHKALGRIAQAINSPAIRPYAPARLAEASGHIRNALLVMRSATPSYAAGPPRGQVAPASPAQGGAAGTEDSPAEVTPYRRRSAPARGGVAGWTPVPRKAPSSGQDRTKRTR